MKSVILWRFSFHFYDESASKSNWLFCFILPLLLPIKKNAAKSKTKLDS